MPKKDPVKPSAPSRSVGVAACSLRQTALAAIGRCVVSDPAAAPPALKALLAQVQLEPAPGRGAPDFRLETYATPEDLPVRMLAAALALDPIEVLTVALLAAVEEDPLVARAIAEVQAPLPGSRPTVGLVATALAGYASRGTAACEIFLSGSAIASGLICVRDEDNPLSERRLALCASVLPALRSRDGAFPGAEIGLAAALEIPLPASHLRELERQSHAFARNNGTLILRSGSEAEARTLAAAIARSLGKRAAFLDSPALSPGLVPWLLARSLIPVFSVELGPGERKRLPPLPLYQGPILVCTGPDGGIETSTGMAPEWTPSIPRLDERAELWRRALGDEALAETMSRRHRHGAGRIAHLARVARHRALLDGASVPTRDHVEDAAWTVEGTGLGGLAQPLRDHVPDEAMVTTKALRQQLDLLLLRCLERDGLADDLGPTLRTRLKSGVRALFVGPSGTGKTLAASWLASGLGKPLYRVDLAATTSKYIGETEKNLAQLLARTEQAEVVLLFDEADSMFGRRTEIKDSNDRFANAQTNYLLQRLESYEGITILTSNSRARFDSAFSRRLDAIIEFSPPGPDERRSIWQSHLGAAHTLSGESLNRLAAVADLSGGHIRNAVLTAAILARASQRSVGYEDILPALTAEYRKLGLPVPQELRNIKPSGGA